MAGEVCVFVEDFCIVALVPDVGVCHGARLAEAVGEEVCECLGFFLEDVFELFLIVCL